MRTHREREPSCLLPRLSRARQERRLPCDLQRHHPGNGDPAWGGPVERIDACEQLANCHRALRSEGTVLQGACPPGWDADFRIAFHDMALCAVAGSHGGLVSRAISARPGDQDHFERTLSSSTSAPSPDREALDLPSPGSSRFTERRQRVNFAGHSPWPPTRMRTN